MKILIIMGGYFPGKKYGGPPVSVDNYCTLMKGIADCYVITHNHDMDEEIPYEGIEAGWNDRGNVKVLYLTNKEYCLASFDRIIKELRPNYIYLQSLFQQCVPACLYLAQKHGLNVVLATRGELCKGAFRKKYKKIPYIVVLRLLGLFRRVVFQSTSEEETEAIGKYLGATPDRIYMLSNIPSIPHDLPQRGKKIKGEGHFVFISRILWKKNLLSAIEYLDDIKGKVIFDIYGPKEDEEYWNECLHAIQKIPKNVKVNYCGVLSHDDIHKTFNQYDAFLFPTLSENFGHVIAESLVTGCVPIISDQTPWNDMNEANAGWALPLSDTKRFKDAIQEIVDMDDETLIAKRHSIEKYLSQKLRMDELKRDYKNVFK